MSDRLTISCCGRTRTSYWHLTYCVRGANKHTDMAKPLNKTPAQSTSVLPPGQMVLDHDHLPPHLRMHNRTCLDTDD